MLSIHDYLLQYQRKVPKILLAWLGVMIFIIAFLLVINNLFYLTHYYQSQGIVKGQYVSIYVYIDEIKEIANHRELMIERQKYQYTIHDISEITMENNRQFYKEILLDINFNDKNLIDNNVVDIKIMLEKRTIFEYIINLIKGEL